MVGRISGGGRGMIAQLDGDYIKTRPTKALSRVVAHLLLQGRPLTTSMRWLNPILMAQYGLVKRLPMVRKVHAPVFVLGTGRSGTTVLGKILGMHRDMLFLNEPKALWHSACRLDDVMGSYQLGEASYTLDSKDADTVTAKHIRKLYSYALLITGSGRVLDKYPEMIFRVPFVRSIFPDAKLLFLIRNGYDALRSIATWSGRAGRQTPGGMEDWWGLDGRKWRLLVRDVVAKDEGLADRAEAIAGLTRHEDRAAVEWVVTMRTGLRLMEEQSGLLHEVRYESLCGDPEAVLRGLCDTCDLRDDPKFLAYAKRTLSRVPARTATELDPVIHDVFKDTMRRLDYPVDLSSAQASA
jgi:sulfotransferase family protein